MTSDGNSQSLTQHLVVYLTVVFRGKIKVHLSFLRQILIVGNHGTLLV